MRDLVQQLLDNIRGGRSVAYCRLVETRGSTPQKAGALMLVYEDGSQAGTLGGGCVEAEVKRRALSVLSDGQAEVCKFQLDSDYGWDDGSICGGRMQVLVEPFSDTTPPEYFEKLGNLTAQGRGLTEAIVFDAEASQLPAPAAFLLDEDDRSVSSSLHASNELPDIVQENLRPLSEWPRPYASHGIAYLPTLPRCRLVIVGGGHVGTAVGNMAADLDFDVWVVDDRDEFVNQNRFPRAERLIQGNIEEVLPTLEITRDTYCLIVTRGHNHDEQALFHLADRGARYVGMIGSRRKIKMIFDDLAGEGVLKEALSRVYAPVGIDIGSQTVPEIAVSICAELVSHRNRGGAVPGRLESTDANCVATG